MRQSTFFVVAGDPLTDDFQGALLNQIVNAEEQGYEVSSWDTSPVATGVVVLIAHCTREVEREEGTEPTDPGATTRSDDISRTYG